MGGVWERIIRSVRKILRVLLREQLVSGEGLRTLMSEGESILNGRPLTPNRDDPADMEPLTPNHLFCFASHAVKFECATWYICVRRSLLPKSLETSSVSR